MKILLNWKMLVAIVVTFALTACGGGGDGGGDGGGTPPPPATYTISGTITGAPSATVTLSGCATASVATTAGATSTVRTYSFSGLSNGTCTITPSLSLYTFSPPSITVTLSSDYSRADFIAISELGGGMGVSFGPYIDGLKSLENTSLSTSSYGVYVTGSDRSSPGQRFSWEDSSGGSGSVTYDSLYDSIRMVFGTRGGTSGLLSCGVSASVVDGSGTVLPICGDVNITFDRASGFINFHSAPLTWTTYSVGVAQDHTSYASGVLSFEPF